MRWAGAVLCFLVFGAVFASGVAAPPDAVASPEDMNVTEIDTSTGQVTPTEQVPIGVRVTYGRDGLNRPSGGEGVTVAVLDTGVDRTHPDLRERVSLCRNFTGDSVRDGCADGNGHGTHVAGTVAADGGPENRGIYGVAPEAELYAFKTCDDEGRCRTEPLQRAIRTATDEGADVIVLSLGGREDPRITDSIRYASERGTIVVAAAGNSGPGIGSILYPSADRQTISVAAVGTRQSRIVDASNYRVPEFSSRGREGPYRDEDEYVDVTGYGVGVLSPVPGGGYARKSGTSMAAPHVAGLVAKILGANPEMAPREVRQRLHERAERTDVTEGQFAREGYDPASGFGLPTVASPVAEFSVDPSIPTADEPFVLDGTPSRAPDSTVAAYAWDTTGDGSFDRRGEQIELSRSAGEHRIRLRVTDDDGATDETTRRVRVNAPPEAAISVDSETPTVESSVRLDATESTDPDGSIVAYEWNLSDGDTRTGPVVETAFSEAGPRNVTLRVVDTDGATGETTRTIRVNAPPEAAISVDPETPTEGKPVRFDGTASVDPDGSIVSHEWELPGGEDATGPVVETTLVETGPKEVTLRVVDDDEATEEVTRELLVNDVPSLSVAVPEQVRAEEPTALEASVDDEFGDVEVTWEFPDGDSRSGEQIERRFSAGETTVVVTATDEFGAATTERVTVRAQKRGLLDQGPSVPPALGAAVVALVVFALARRR